MISSDGMWDRDIEVGGGGQTFVASWTRRVQGEERGLVTCYFVRHVLRKHNQYHFRRIIIMIHP